MESHPAELLRDALALPLEARSALIDSLIESLDTTVDEGATEAWKREIELRLEQIDDRSSSQNGTSGPRHVTPIPEMVTLPRPEPRLRGNRL